MSDLFKRLNIGTVAHTPALPATTGAVGVPSIDNNLVDINDSMTELALLTSDMLLIQEEAERLDFQASQIEKITAATAGGTPIMTARELALVTALTATGSDGTQYIAMPGIESYGSSVTPQDATEAGIEALKDTAAKFWKILVDNFNKFLDVIINNFNKLFGGAEKLARSAKALAAKVDGGDKDQSKDKVKIVLKNFTTDGSAYLEGTALVAAITALKNTVKDAGKVGAQCGTVMEQVEKILDSNSDIAKAGGVTPEAADTITALDTPLQELIGLTEAKSLAVKVIIGQKHLWMGETDDLTKYSAAKADGMSGQLTAVKAIKPGFGLIAAAKKVEGKSKEVAPCVQATIVKLANEIEELANEVKELRIEAKDSSKAKALMASIAKSGKSLESDDAIKGLAKGKEIVKLAAGIALAYGPLGNGAITSSVAAHALTIGNSALKYASASY